MTKFKADDVVECINAEGISLDPDFTYTVNWCNKNYVAIECVAGCEYIFNPSRFKLVKSPVTFVPPSYRFRDDDEDIYVDSAEHLLRKAASTLEDCHQYELAEEINTFLGEE